MNVSDFIVKYRKSLQNRIEDISLSLSTGGCSSYEDYRAMVGEIQGLSYALDDLQTLLKKANHDEDSLGT